MNTAKEKRLHVLKKMIAELEAEQLKGAPLKARETNKRLIAVWDDEDCQWYFIVQVEKRREHSAESCPQLTLHGPGTGDEELRGEAIRFCKVVGIDARLYPFSVER